MKLNKMLGAFTALTFLALPACDDKKDEKKDDKKAEEKKDDEKADEKAEEKAEEKKDDEDGGDDDGGGGADKIGVPECDEYIEKYTKCIEDKMPEEGREAAKTAMDQTVSAWREAAQGPGKDAMAEGCKAALEAVKKSSEAFGCEW
jgi:hypothetical protein